MTSCLSLCALLSLSLLQDGPPPQDPPMERGLHAHTEAALDGYTLISPLKGKTLRLVDMKGREVHRWPLEYGSGCEYFLDDGSILRCARIEGAETFSGGGQCGRLERIAWDGTLLWHWEFASAQHLQHHDIELTPDGTILLIAWELKDYEECLEAGRKPERLKRGGAMWPDMVLEIDPYDEEEADVLWEWHAWEHLIQDTDPDKPNYGDPSKNPHRIDINGDENRQFTAAEVAQMRALGYLGDETGEDGDQQLAPDQTGDWLHCNGIDYDAERDLIVLSTPKFNEVWIIDHSTSSAESAGSEGGDHGRGGDLLWRWGNPATYKMAATDERSLFFQHDPRFIPAGHPGAGRLTIFNNGGGRPDGKGFSEVLELELPIVDGRFRREEGMPFGPFEPSWVYATRDTAFFFSSFISGATRLRNGNTLICDGDSGRVFEVTAEGEVVWDFRHDFQPADGGAPGVPAHALFRATRIPADHPGLKGKNLSPLKGE